MILVTSHALHRAAERFMQGPEFDHDDWRALIVQLWLTGEIERWSDPDDRPGCTTVTSLIPPHPELPLAGHRVLVGREEHGSIVIVSALSYAQYWNNARTRWSEPATREG